MRAPGGGSQDNSRGPLLLQRFSPNPPLRLTENTQIIRWPELWLILAGPMALNNLTLAQKRAEAPQGMRAASALTTGGSGGCLWLGPRIAQRRCESEWTHLSCRTECVHSDRQAPGDGCQWLGLRIAHRRISNQRPRTVEILNWKRH